MTTGLRKTLTGSFDEVRTRITEALKTEGFGVLTEIDVKNTLNQKLGVDFRRYVILGACNPPFAHQALLTDLEAGLMMPCNVVLYETDDGKVTIMGVDPSKSAAAIGNARLTELASTVRSKLESALAALG